MLDFSTWNRSRQIPIGLIYGLDIALSDGVPHKYGTYRTARSCESSSLPSLLWILIVFVASVLCCLGCAGVGGSGQPPPPPVVQVSVSPTSATALLGGAQQFSATVTNATNTSVTWTVNNISGGNSALGTISTSGLYTAPQILPQLAAITIKATSQADGTTGASANLTVTSDIVVHVLPAIANVELGAAQHFTATITSAGNPNLAVVWSVSGVGCAGLTCGTVDSTGNYVAPGILPALPGITITATSVADPSKNAAAAVTVTSRFTFTVIGPTSLNAGATGNYTATLTPIPNSNPSAVITWSVSGTGCVGGACGSISSSGATAVYQAPVIAPRPNTVTILATPGADPNKGVSIVVTINDQITVVVSPTTSSVALSQTQGFSAQVTGASDTSVIWDVNGVTGGNSTVGTVTNVVGTHTTTYTAPVAMPSPGAITVEARANANTTFTSTAVVTLTSQAALTLAPLSSTLAVSHRQTFTAGITGSANTNVTWQVNGIAGGNTGVGQICAVGSGACQPITSAPAGSVDYLAPAGVPSPNPVTLTAVSQANPSQSMNAGITILAHITVSVSPPSVVVSPGGTQLFTATLVGTSDQSVTWNVAGTACSGLGSPCGSISAIGLYSAPLSTPSPNIINIVATSSEDNSRTGTAGVSIAATPTITSMFPSSAFAGSVGGFTFRVQGGNFVSSNPGPGSSILVAGSARTTSCSTNGDCTTTLTSSDLAVPGNLAVQLQNPDSTLSNIVNFVVVGDAGSADVIPLTPSNPVVTGKNIIVVEPSTAGSSAPQSNVTLAIVAMGNFNTQTNSCSLGAEFIILSRPNSGTATADICLFSVSGLDPSYNYTISGPATPDILIIGKQPLGFGIVNLTLSVTSSAQKGPRTLFVENPNKDKAAASGSLEVK